MHPYFAQRAANGIGDAAVIATTDLHCTSNVQSANCVCETVRKERTERIAASASDTSRSLHLPDGPEQEKTDWATQSAGRKEKAVVSDIADKRRDQEWQDYM